MSTNLFIIYAEGLVALIKQVEMRGSLKGFKVARDAQLITVLFFADDNVLYFRAKQEDCDAIKGILAYYERASGQLINTSKSGMWFSRNTSHNAKELV